jgi:hypothetical protein
LEKGKNFVQQHGQGSPAKDEIQGLIAIGEPAGAELKCVVTKDLKDAKREKLLEILFSVVEMIRKNGLNE